MQSDSSSVKVRNAAQAINEVLLHLREQQVPEVPDTNTRWQEKTIYSTEPMDYAITSKLYTSDDWLIEVFQGVALVSRTVYQITVFNSRLHCYWQGSIRADGGITEENTYELLPEEESQKLAEEFLKKSRVSPPRPGGYGH